jgi:hypothetical protein
LLQCPCFTPTLYSCQLAKSAHLGSSIVFGEYRGLDKDVSAIDVSTAIQEQLNMLESLPTAGLSTVESELVRRGFDTKGVKESVTKGWHRFTLAEKSYAEVVEANVSRCQRSAFSTAEALQLYVSQFGDETLLSAPDRIFLQASDEMKIQGRRMNPSSNETSGTSTFVEKAARLGISITPQACRAASIPPPLYESDAKQQVAAGFEQINETMFARKDNKFMVLNQPGVDSWNSTCPITKISRVDDILRSSLV